MNSRSHFRFMVAIETDSTRYHGEHATHPGLLNRNAAEQMLAHLSADLAGLFPEARHCALTMPGALYDQTQLLRPGYPLYSSLESIFDSSLEGGEFEPRLLSIGADDGVMPDPALQPSASIPPGLLQILPLLISGESSLVSALAEEMELRFMEAGQLSAHSARALEAQFGVKLNHARLMTVTDLNAMLHLQLDHFGFLPLWDLVDAAINAPETPMDAQGRGGQQFRWNGTKVECQFETFDYWANKGSGREIADVDQALAKGYADWTREYRQYLTTLQAHAVGTETHAAGAPGSALEGSFLVEESSLMPQANAAQVTEHSSGDLGTVAVTMISGERQLNYYPLQSAGLNQLHAAIRQYLGESVAVSFPGCVLHDRRERKLIADSVSQTP